MEKRIKKIVFVGIFTAMSFVLFMFPKFPIIPAFPWLEADLSEVPALLAAMLMSPMVGLVVVLIKNIIHLAFSSTGMVGELSNFLINGIFVFASGIFFKYIFKSEKKFVNALLATLVGVVFQIAASVAVNYYIMIPLYMYEGFPALPYILTGVVPFNAVKDAIASATFLSLFKVLYVRYNRVVNK